MYKLLMFTPGAMIVKIDDVASRIKDICLSERISMLMLPMCTVDPTTSLFFRTPLLVNSLCENSMSFPARSMLICSENGKLTIPASPAMLKVVFALQLIVTVYLLLGTSMICDIFLAREMTCAMSSSIMCLTTASFDSMTV